jgi:hypothetical protein
MTSPRHTAPHSHRALLPAQRGSEQRYFMPTVPAQLITRNVKAGQLYGQTSVTSVDRAKRAQSPKPVETQTSKIHAVS